MSVPRKPGSKLKIVILGYYGFGNLGDEAVLAGIRASLASVEAFRRAHITVLSNDPAETMRLHPGVHAANRWNWSEAVAAMKDTDLFIFGGGSLLQDATSARSVYWYAMMVMLARSRAKRILWWGQGIGPLEGNLTRPLVRNIANRADAITVRDPASEKELKALGTKGSIEVVADPAFALDPETGFDSKRTSPILVSLRRWKKDDFGTLWSGISAQEAVRQIVKDTQVNFRLLPMHLPDDAKYMMKPHLFPDAACPDWRTQGDTIAQIMGSVIGAKLMIAMRLHALIFAARCGVPFIALSYDPKIDALAWGAGQRDVLMTVSAGLAIEDITQTTQLALDTHAERAEQLKAFGEQQSILARRPARIAADWLA